MRYVLDATFFFSDMALEGDLYTVPSVHDELKDIRSKSRFDVLCAGGLTVAVPSQDSLDRADATSGKTRDAAVLSGTDRELIALALELDAVLCTDDFAIQNVALVLGVKTLPILQRKARRVRWKYRCSGCGRYADHDGECPVCGAAIKRKLK